MPDVLSRIEGDDGEVLLIFECPGCGYGHHYRIKAGTASPTAPVWTWNGSMDKPTFSPSLLVNSHRPEKRCHLFCREGRLQFLGDCFHELKGKTVDMAPVDDG